MKPQTNLTNLINIIYNQIFGFVLINDYFKTIAKHRLIISSYDSTCV